jgi:large subunit ribosomal protein L14
MIQVQTYLFVSDNTGVKKIMCIRILGNNKKYGNIGDIIIGVVKSVNSISTIKKASIVRCLIIRTKKNIQRLDGTIIKFNENSVVLLNNNNNLIGTRIFGPIPFEIRNNFLKITSLANEII